MQRRDFLRHSALAAVAAGTAGCSIGPPRAGDIQPDDEEFWARVRDCFPLGRHRTYLNTGGLGASPRKVIDAVARRTEELEEVSESGHGGPLWISAKQKAAAVLGADPDEIALTRNTTEGVSVVCNGLALEPGDEVITSTHEHVGNLIAWLARGRRDGIVIKAFEPSRDSDTETLERIQGLITARTRVISVAHVTCSTGQILPARQIGELARLHGLFYFLDGAQAPGMMPVRVREYGCGAYATSGHKWLLGPKGTGLLYVRKDLLDSVAATFVGAYSVEGDAWNLQEGTVELCHSAQRYEYGTVNAPLVIGFGASLGFLQDLGEANVWRHDHALAARLIAGLQELGVEVCSPVDPARHSAMVTFRVPGMPYPELYSVLAKRHRLRVRGIYEGGVDGVRVSFHVYNNFGDVDRVLAGVEDAMQHG